MKNKKYTFVKKMFLMLLCIVTLLSFVGCSVSNNRDTFDEKIGTEEITDVGWFEHIKVEYVHSDLQIYVYRDKNTDIMYQYFRGVANTGGLSVMYDIHGKPMTYETYKQMVEYNENNK